MVRFQNRYNSYFSNISCDIIFMMEKIIILLSLKTFTRVHGDFVLIKTELS